MATRTLNRMLIAARWVMVLLLVPTILLAVAAVRLDDSAQDQAQVPPPASLRPFTLEWVSVEQAGDASQGHGVFQLWSQQTSADVEFVRPRTTPATAADVPMLAAAGALLSAGALMGAVVQYSVIRVLDGRSPERRFP